MAVFTIRKYRHKSMSRSATIFDSHISSHLPSNGSHKYGGRNLAVHYLEIPKLLLPVLYIIFLIFISILIHNTVIHFVKSKTTENNVSLSLNMKKLCTYFHHQQLKVMNDLFLTKDENIPIYSVINYPRQEAIMHS